MRAKLFVRLIVVVIVGSGGRRPLQRISPILRSFSRALLPLLLRCSRLPAGHSFNRLKLAINFIIIHFRTQVYAHFSRLHFHWHRVGSRRDTQTMEVTIFY